MLPAFPVIVGPTASGKSSLAMDLARWLRDERGTPGEIVSMDSMMVFRGMDIGTAKPTTADRDEVPHHCLDLVEPTERFSVRQWLDAATEAIEKVRGAGGVPVVVGGTHLYAMALLQGLFEGPPANDALRAELSALAPQERRERLEDADPTAAGCIHPNDTRRTIRALEVVHATGQPISTQQTQWDEEPAGVPGATPFVLLWESAPLNARINARVREMLEEGLVEEARGLHESGKLGPQACEALGYKQLIPFFEGAESLEKATERIKIETRRFAKNQRTSVRRLVHRHGARTVPGDRAESAMETRRAFCVGASS